MKGQQYRYRSRRKTTTGCGDCVVLIMRTFGTGERVVSATKACSYLLSSILSVRFITMIKKKGGHQGGHPLHPYI